MFLKTNKKRYLQSKDKTKSRTQFSILLILNILYMFRGTPIEMKVRQTASGSHAVTFSATNIYLLMHFKNCVIAAMQEGVT